MAEEAAAHPVAVFQRIDQAGYKLPIDERILADTDTLMVFGLDHFLSQQEPAREEIAATTQWLEREGTCLLLVPHHDVGFTDVSCPTTSRIPNTTATDWCPDNNASVNTPGP